MICIKTLYQEIENDANGIPCFAMLLTVKDIGFHVFRE